MQTFIKKHWHACLAVIWVSYMFALLGWMSGLFGRPIRVGQIWLEERHAATPFAPAEYWTNLVLEVRDGWLLVRVFTPSNPGGWETVMRNRILRQDAKCVYDPKPQAVALPRAVHSKSGTNRCLTNLNFRYVEAEH